MCACLGRQTQHNPQNNEHPFCVSFVIALLFPSAVAKSLADLAIVAAAHSNVENRNDNATNDDTHHHLLLQKEGDFAKVPCWLWIKHFSGHASGVTIDNGKAHCGPVGDQCTMPPLQFARVVSLADAP